ncbi:MAG: succinate dehydrogenase, cytochrome b556 subunit [Azospirillum sp.]|nr:succinate dehydrogenase, cytochrome b556 subunit [Azospirillum sp.]
MANGIRRPISPFLSVYKLQETMIMSGLHRITGMGLIVGLLLFTWWLVAAAAGPAYFAVVQGFLGFWLGKLMLFGWTFCLFYHFSNGIRHMVWDCGRSLEKESIVSSGWVMAGSAVALTLLAWVVGLLVLAAK